MTRRAAFLDRDGTLNARPPEHEYVADADDFVWLPGAAEAVACLARAGYLVAVVSNQRGVARGLVSVETIREVEKRIQRDLARHGARVAAFRYCFHGLDEDCACRKPRPGLLQELASELDLDLSGSWMIGDSDSDVFAGQAAGCRTAFVGAGAPDLSRPDLVGDSLLDAAGAIAAVQGAGPLPSGLRPSSAANSSANE